MTWSTRVALALSVQVLFWSMFIRLGWNVGRLLQLARRQSRESRFVVSFLTAAAHRYGDDPVTVQGELLRCVNEYRQTELVTARTFLQRLWRRR